MLKEGAFEVVLRHRYLLLIAILILLTNWINTTGKHVLGNVVSTAAHSAVSRITDPETAKATERISIGEFCGDFFLWVNICGLLLQLFAVPRSVKFLGMRAAIIALPIIALGGYFLIAFSPLLALIKIAKTAENSTDYSFNTTAQQMLFSPTTRGQKIQSQGCDRQFLFGRRRCAFGRAGVLGNLLLVVFHHAVCSRQYRISCSVAGAGIFRGGRHPTQAADRESTSSLSVINRNEKPPISLSA